jgi:hypothetical protein
MTGTQKYATKPIRRTGHLYSDISVSRRPCRPSGVLRRYGLRHGQECEREDNVAPGE